MPVQVRLARPVLARAAVIAAAAVAALALATSSSHAQSPPFDRGIERACPAGNDAGDPFVDVDATDVHGAAIECAWIYGIAAGSFDGDGELVYRAAPAVTRQQMASFVASMLDSVPDSIYALPELGDEALDDAPYADAEDISGAHMLNVNRLTEAGLVRGTDDGEFLPTRILSRAQMASFVVQAIEAVTETELARAAVFDDIDGTHRANIEKLAAVGVTSGRATGGYGPDEPITRSAMASFLARSLDYLVEQERFRAMSYSAGDGLAARLGLTDVEGGVHDDADRVTFTFEGDDGAVGWRVQYVDEARSQGSGELIEVEGEAILQVVFTGMALPPDLPEDIEERLFDASPLAVAGESVVEVVDDGVFEGQQQLYIGTTGLHPFTVERLADPQRVYVDVEHQG